MKKERRYDLDWIRVIVFDLLIIYHVGMFFVPWGWHIKNNILLESFVIPMMFLNQWRIPILFVISGMGTRFALSHRSGGTFAKERFTRLFLPLLFGMLVIVPPQVYLERLTQGIDFSSYFDFYPHFFDGIYPKGNLSWHHLWFLPYLFVYSLLLTPVFVFLRNQANGSFLNGLRTLIGKYPMALYLFALPLLLVEISLEPYYPITHAFVGDWYAHAMYLLLFLFGFILISIKDVLWKALDRIRLSALVIGLVGFPILVGLYNLAEGHWIIPLVATINMWSWILVIFGFASKYLNKPGKIISYRNRAVYPFYILHQTITIIIGYSLMNLDWPIVVKFIILAVGTFLISWLIYEGIVKRTRFTRFVFGLKG